MATNDAASITANHNQTGLFMVEPLQMPVSKIKAGEFQTSEKTGFKSLHRLLRHGVIEIERTKQPPFYLLTHDLMVALTSRTHELVIPQSRYESMSSETISDLSRLRQIAILVHVPRPRGQQNFIWPQFSYRNSIGYLGQYLSLVSSCRKPRAFLIVTQTYLKDLCQRGTIKLTPAQKVKPEKHIDNEFCNMYQESESGRFSTAHRLKLLSQAPSGVTEATLVLPTTELSCTGVTGIQFKQFRNLADNQVYRISMDRGLFLEARDGRGRGIHDFLGPQTLLTYDHLTGELHGRSLSFVMTENLFHRLILRAKGTCDRKKIDLGKLVFQFKTVDVLNLSAQHFIPQKEVVTRVSDENGTLSPAVIVPEPLFRILYQKADLFSVEVGKFDDSQSENTPNGKMLSDPLYWEQFRDNQIRSLAQNRGENPALAETDLSLNN